MTFDEQCERDARLALEPDGRDFIEDTPCPCGEPIIDTECWSEMNGTSQIVTLRYWHRGKEFPCEFRRKF